MGQNMCSLVSQVVYLLLFGGVRAMVRKNRTVIRSGQICWSTVQLAEYVGCSCTGVSTWMPPVMMDRWTVKCKELKFYVFVSSCDRKIVNLR